MPASISQYGHEAVQLVAGRRRRAGRRRWAPAPTSAPTPTGRRGRTRRAAGLGVTTGVASHAATTTATARTASRVAGRPAWARGPRVTSAQASPARKRNTGIAGAVAVGEQVRQVRRADLVVGQAAPEHDVLPAEALGLRVVGRDSPGGTRFSDSWLWTPPNQATKAGSSSAAWTRAGIVDEGPAERVEPRLLRHPHARRPRTSRPAGS